MERAQHGAELGTEPDRTPTVIRLFAGYAGSPLRSAAGPVDLEAAGFDGELRADLEDRKVASYGRDGLLAGALPKEDR